MSERLRDTAGERDTQDRLQTLAPSVMQELLDEQAGNTPSSNRRTSQWTFAQGERPIKPPHPSDPPIKPPKPAERPPSPPPHKAPPEQPTPSPPPETPSPGRPEPPQPQPGGAG